jgi:hypothetical protein
VEVLRVREAHDFLHHVVKFGIVGDGELLSDLQCLIEDRLVFGNCLRAGAIGPPLVGLFPREYPAFRLGQPLRDDADELAERFGLQAFLLGKCLEVVLRFLALFGRLRVVLLL